jgi:hypothetical protein
MHVRTLRFRRWVIEAHEQFIKPTSLFAPLLLPPLRFPALALPHAISRDIKRTPPAPTPGDVERHIWHQHPRAHVGPECYNQSRDIGREMPYKGLAAGEEEDVNHDVLRLGVGDSGFGVG